MNEQKKHILVVDDDPVILRIYQEGLARQGFRVSSATDGLAAIKAIVETNPDLLVLDLMMPKFSGVDVLKYVRKNPAFASLPVVVFSNAYMNEIAAEAASLGVQKALLKIRSSPSRLAGIIEDVLAGRDTPDDSSYFSPPAREAPSAAGKTEQRLPSPGAPASRVTRPLANQPPRAPVPASPAVSKDWLTTDTQFRGKTRPDFLARGAETVGTLRILCDGLVTARSDSERKIRLSDLFRKVHFLVAAAGMADCSEISQLASVLEALLYDLIAKPHVINPSVLRTCDQALNVFPALFQRAAEPLPSLLSSARVLTVDDDAACNRLVVAALQRAQLQAQSLEHVQQVLSVLKEKKFDLLLLDVEMPLMGGFELCRVIRMLPGYKTTPVIYVTGNADFESRQRNIASGGDDVIGKPILPLELAVKVVLHLLRGPK